MERVHTLINKLQEQFNKKENSSLLLATAQLLVNELSQENSIQQIGKVSVLMPSNYIEINQTTIDEPANNLQKSFSEKENRQTFELVFDDLDLVPTLALQDNPDDLVKPIEINNLINDDTKSFNDLLKENKIEIALKLTETPIKDLRKAIGINDKYTFINELFKGDENLYENSIKTINNLSVFPEADQWIRRELMITQNWDTKSDTVKYFDQLVRRRFA